MSTRNGGDKLSEPSFPSCSHRLHITTNDDAGGDINADDRSVSVADCTYDDDAAEFRHPNLDENGFPVVDESSIDDLASESCGDVDGNAVGDCEGFAADFYRCGSDWSSLVLDNGKTLKNLAGGGLKNEESEKKMKQTDLFQMWGLSRKQQQPPLPAQTHPPSKRAKLFKFESSVRSSDSPKYGKASLGGLEKVESRPRSCPFYKKIPGTPFTVDAFRYGMIPDCSAYFLSHFHADHYGGLTKKWSHGPIYCTPITARLLRICLYVDPRFICPLELDMEHEIDGVKVTFLEANHCPGAALIHFLLPCGKRFLHTGDFRASKMMQNYPLLVNQRVDVLYLDTTYCNPKYKFPSKEDVLDFVVKISNNWRKKHPKTLIAVGAYSIGKECVYLSISKALGLQIYANASRRRILQSFGWPEFSSNLCSSGKETCLHVMPMSHLRFETLNEYLKTFKGHYTTVLAFRPTGWTYSQSVGDQLDLIKPNSKGNVTIYGVPYSEHSSFTELQEFVQFLKPDKIIPTVNVANASSRDKMQSCFRDWLKEC